MDRVRFTRATLFAKLLCLALIKFATLDPLGMGIEMEAERPGWYDALNGLPGLFGSSMPETYELARLLDFLRGALSWPDTPARRYACPSRSTSCWQAVLAPWMTTTSVDATGFPLLGCRRHRARNLPRAHPPGL